MSDSKIIPFPPGSTPWNVNVGDVIDFRLNLEFTKSFESALQQIRATDLECRQWRYVAQQLSISMAGTDVSTPKKFFGAQLVRIAEILDENDRLKEELKKVQPQA